MVSVANRAEAGKRLFVNSPQFPVPGNSPCDGKTYLSFYSRFGSAGSGVLKVTLATDVSPFQVIAILNYGTNGSPRFENILLDQTFFPANASNDVLQFEFIPTGTTASEYWYIDDLLVQCQ